MNLIRTIQLQDLIKEVGKKNAKKYLSDFSCPLNKDIENFIREKSIPFECAGMARTTLVFLQDNTSNPKLVAFYSITTSKINLDNINKGNKRKLIGTSYAVGNEISAILIGQLSKNYAYDYDKLISGKTLMGLVFKRIYEIDKMVPSILTYVDFQDISKLKSYYKSYGFEYLRTNTTKNETLLCYVIQTKKIIDKVDSTYTTFNEQ